MHLLKNAPTFALMLLMACGEEEGTVISPTPAPAPTPVPSPTPTPHPTPTPYDWADDFTRDRSFTAFGTSQTFSGMQSTAVALDSTVDAIGFQFTADTRFYATRYRDAALDISTNLVGSNPAYDEYRSGDGEDPYRYFARISLTPQARYVGLLLWHIRRRGSGTDTQTNAYRMIFGARTNAQDMPTSGKSTMQGNAEIANNGPTMFNAERRTATVSVEIDWATRTGSGQITLAASSGTDAPAIYPMALSIGNDGQVLGSIRRQQGSFRFNGTMQGAIFGPGGREAGLVFQIENSTHYETGSAIVALKQGA